ncbi:unnamed protein product, partial [Meganyctiphanes norvegica]
QLQGDHPFCYVNPVALDSHDATSTPSSATPQHDGGGSSNSLPPKAPTQKRRKFTAPNGHIPLHLPIVKKIQSKREEIKHYSRAPKMTLSPIMTKSPKLSRRNTTTNKNVLPPPLNSLETSLEVKPEIKDNKDLPKEHKPSNDKDGHVISFAAQLEQSLRKLEQEIQRSGGEYVRPNSDPPIFDSEVESPLEECSTVFREDEFPDSESQLPMVVDGMSQDLHNFQEDIWKPSELEDAFEGYNKAALFSYGHYMTVDTSGHHRNQNGKYHEVFPPNIHNFRNSNNDRHTDSYNNNNNDNSIRNQNKSIESEGSFVKCDQDKAELNKESETCLDLEQKHLTKEKLLHVINICVFENKFDDACEQFTKNELICDDFILYDGRSFNKQLIFDLVKTTMCECNDLYKISMALSETYPIELVQKRVITYLEKKIDDTALTPSGIQAFRNAIDPNRVIDENSFKSALLAEKIIEDVLFEESKEDGRMWQDVKQ